MGCDIHTYLDYDEFKKHDGSGWYASNVAKFYINRNYILFAVLAGVRNYDNVVPVSKPKGMPDNLSYFVEDDYTLSILNKNDGDVNEDGCCSYEEGKHFIELAGGCWRGDERRVAHPDWHSASWFNVDELREVQRIYSSMSMAPDIKHIGIHLPIPKGYKLSKYEGFSFGGDEHYKWVEKIDPGKFGKHRVLEGIINMMDLLNDGDINRTRFIFWFDN